MWNRSVKFEVLILYLISIIYMDIVIFVSNFGSPNNAPKLGSPNNAPKLCILSCQGNRNDTVQDPSSSYSQNPDTFVFQWRRTEKPWEHWAKQSTPSDSGSVRLARLSIASDVASKETTISTNSVPLSYYIWLVRFDIRVDWNRKLRFDWRFDFLFGRDQFRGIGHWWTSLTKLRWSTRKHLWLRALQSSAMFLSDEVRPFGTAVFWEVIFSHFVFLCSVKVFAGKILRRLMWMLT